MQRKSIGDLIKHFESLSDPRVDRTRDHELIDILVIGLCCVICGGDSFNDMEHFGQAKLDWFKTFLSLPNGVPSHDTFNRVFSALDPQKFLDCFLSWTQSVRAAIAQEIVALDGKALRRAIDAGAGPRCIVSAWAEDNGLVLANGKWTRKAMKSPPFRSSCARWNWLAASSRSTRWAARKTSRAKSKKPMRSMCWPSKATRGPFTRKSKRFWTQLWPERKSRADRRATAQRGRAPAGA
jgi:hypothetical protein